MGPPEGKDYKWYMNGKKPANWGMDYATDPTFYGNQKQPFTFFFNTRFWLVAWFFRWKIPILQRPNRKNHPVFGVLGGVCLDSNPTFSHQKWVRGGVLPGFFFADTRFPIQLSTPKKSQLNLHFPLGILKGGKTHTHIYIYIYT